MPTETPFTHTHVHNKTIKVKQNKRGKLTAELLNNVGKQINYLHSKSATSYKRRTFTLTTDDYKTENENGKISSVCECVCECVSGAIK